MRGGYWRKYSRGMKTTQIYRTSCMLLNILDSDDVHEFAPKALAYIMTYNPKSVILYKWLFSLHSTFDLLLSI